MSRKYEYDPLSNITGISSSGATSPTLGALGGPVEHTYLYDNYNRLTHADGYYVGPDDEVPDMLKQAYSLDMEYDLSHNILEKNQLHQFGSVTSVNQSLPATARHAQTSYRLEYSGYGTATYAHRQPHAPRMITEYPQEDYSGDPEDPRIKRKHISYDANGNQLEIQEEVKDPSDTRGYRLQSLRKNLWDAEDRLLAVDLDPESDEDKPLVAIYTYDAGGERTIKYVPARIDSRYSAKESGDAERLEAMIYPNALVTAKVLPIPPNMLKEKDLKVVKYTKHYYIGSERIASFLGTKRGMGLYCGGEPVAVQDTLNSRVIKAGEALERVFDYFEKTIDPDAPFLYGPSSGPVCGDTHVPEELGTYWYHPDHLGSSSYITNLQGEISQHMEYLPFGETLVEEHLNSNNSPYKFNAKEFDSETGNYYYHSRYYDPKFSLFLGVDEHYFNYPSFSPYIYTFQNPVKYIDPDGRDGIVAGSGTKQDPYVVTANYYHHGLSEEQASGLQSAADAFNNRGRAHQIKDGEGNNIYVQFNIGVQETTSAEEANNLAMLDYVDLSDGSSARFGNVVGLGNSSDNDHFGQASRFNIDLNQARIDNTLAEFPGGNMNDILKGTFIHEIGHNLGGNHGDPGSIMRNFNISENRSPNLMGGGNRTFNYSGPSVNKNGIRAIMGRIDMSPSATNPRYLSQRENENVSSSTVGRLKRVN